MIKKYKCDFCNEYYSLEEMDGEFLCPECLQQVDKNKSKIFAQSEEQENEIQNDDDENFSLEDEQNYYDQQEIEEKDQDEQQE